MKTVSVSNGSLDPNMYSVPCGRMPALFIGDKMVVTMLSGEKLDVTHDKLTVF
jgi:hypothetical protein